MLWTSLDDFRSPPPEPVRSRPGVGGSADDSCCLSSNHFVVSFELRIYEFLLFTHSVFTVIALFIYLP
jgi:hypothetical protein